MKPIAALALCLCLVFPKPAPAVECSEENSWCFLPTMIAIYISTVVLNELEKDIRGWLNDYIYQKSLTKIKDGLPQLLTDPKTANLDFSNIDDSTKIIDLASQLFIIIVSNEQHLKNFTKLRLEDLQEPHFSLLAALEIINFWLLVDDQYGDGFVLFETDFNDFWRNYQCRFTDNSIMESILRSSRAKF